MSPRHAKPDEPQEPGGTPVEPAVPAGEPTPGGADERAPLGRRARRGAEADPTTDGGAPVTPPDAGSAAGAPPAVARPAPPAGPPAPGRPRWVLPAVVAVVLVLLGALVAWVLRSDDGTPDPAPTPTAFAEQGTLLLQIRKDDEYGADNMIAAAGGGLPAAQVLVPSRLIVDVPGAGQQSLGQSARQLDRSASQDALSDLLAVRIDGTLSLARLALVGLVDFVGGITVTVDAPVVEVDDDTGEETVVVPGGSGHLTGTQAAAYALLWLPDEPEAARLARFSTVMTATVSSLPDDRLRVDQMLTSLGGSARTTIATGEVAEFLLEMRRGILEGGQQVRVLPTTDIEAGGSLSVVRADLSAADGVMRSLLPDAVLSGTEARARVLVQNGVGTPGLGAAARDMLVEARMVYINGGNAEQFGQEVTLVLVADESPEAQALGEEVAQALGVPATAVQIAESGQNVADAVVVLGADFEP